MASVNQNITLYKHRYNAVRVTVNGVDNIAGWKIYFVMTDDNTQYGDVILEKDINVAGGNEGIRLDGATAFYIDIEPEDMTEILQGTYYYEIMMDDTAGKPYQGTVGSANVRDVALEDD